MNAAQQREIERAKAWAAEQLAKRKGTTRVDLEISLWDLDGLTVDELVEWAQGIRDQAPEAHRADCKLNYQSGGDDAAASLDGHYYRTETDADRAADSHYQNLKAIAEKGTRE